MDVDLGRWRRFFPFALGAERCPECDGWMTEDYVRAPSLQDHWRGIRAMVCEDCGYARAIDGRDPQT